MIYSNYEWEKYEKEFQYLNIITLKPQEEAEHIEEVELFSEKSE